MTYAKLPQNLKDRIKGKVTENPDGSISVDGDVYWEYRRLTKLPIQFKEVTGNFWCHDNQLTSLDGAPQIVGGSFICSINQLTSLDSAPQIVGGSFFCSNNQFTSLDGLGEVKGEIHCSYNYPIPADQLLADRRKQQARRELTGESLAVDRLCR
jgi:hypothetical protein